MVKYGRLMEQKTAEIYEMFQPVEGVNNVYYGKVRNGKTYAATADIINLLESGEVVYANWNIDFSGYDERNSLAVVFIKTFFGKKYFYHFKKENFHYFHPDKIDVDMLGRLVGVHVFIDEGQWIFNSHTRDYDPKKSRLILHGGHYCRSLNVITQRPQNILKDIRSQINIWYKCEKKLHIGNIILFFKYPIQEMKDDLPDEESCEKPVRYWASKKVFGMYNTHAMRDTDAIIEAPSFDVYETSSWDRWLMLLSLVFGRKGRSQRPAASAVEEKPVPVSSIKVERKDVAEATAEVLAAIQAGSIKPAFAPVFRKLDVRHEKTLT